jgi:predicted ATPase
VAPLLTALPGAQILELSDDGICARTRRVLELTTNWLRFLEAPDTLLRYITGDGAESLGEDSDQA